MKARGGFGSLPVFILNLGIGCGGWFSATLRPRYPREIVPCAYCTGGWVDRSKRVCGEYKIFRCQGCSNLEPSSL